MSHDDTQFPSSNSARVGVGAVFAGCRRRATPTTATIEPGTKTANSFRHRTLFVRPGGKIHHFNNAELVP